MAILSGTKCPRRYKPMAVLQSSSIAMSHDPWFVFLRMDNGRFLAFAGTLALNMLLVFRSLFGRLSNTIPLTFPFAALDDRQDIFQFRLAGCHQSEHALAVFA